MKIITELRRSDKVIDNLEEIETILKKADVGYMAVSRDKNPYTIPVNFLYDDEKIYIHCALEGKKLQYIEQNHKVCFLVNERVHTSNVECGDAVSYHSVIAFGVATFTRTPNITLLKKLGAKYHVCDQVDHGAYSKTGLITIKIKEISAKRGY